MTSPKTPFERAMALAALSGFKVALGPAFLAAKRRSPSTGTWALAALGEMFLDKVGIFPPRYRPALMIPHALSGAYVAREAMKEEGVHDPSIPVLGAVVAAGVACVAPLARIALNRGLGMPDAFLGLGEDYLALNLGSEATGVSLGQVSEITRDAVEDLRGQIAPSLPSIPNLPVGTGRG
ncbi:hypothetical protein OJF2_49910 [Aquisphaera giovannonii]|uniref:DUF4126 domain-containing protein n=1 Tax=Aquisphaera giovannonii TaxID=406548 RepID=A0A5B9W7V6_9BACT|nr:hypothetical protein [Aquisphaera giovannonii]QEH36427.1 hypothetical protein OJF2_49910 [Aquisphaera giovannonii]